MSTNPPAGSGPNSPSKPKRRRRPRKYIECMTGAEASRKERNRSIDAYLRSQGFPDPTQFCSDPGSSLKVLIAIAKRWRYTDDELLGIVARNPALPMEHLLNLARTRPVDVSENPVFRLRMATEPGFLQSLNHIVRRNLAMGRGLDHRLLRELASARKHEKSVRRAAAMNTTTPMDMLEGFVRHAWEVRAGLASNPVLPVHLQMKLAQDPRREVRRVVARRTKVSPEVLRYLGENDTDQRVHLNLVGNAKTPDITLKHLAEHGRLAVRREVEARMESPKMYLHGPRAVMQLIHQRLEDANDPCSP